MEKIVSRTLSVHQEHEFLMRFEAAGLTGELAQKVIDSKGNDLAVKVVRLIKNGGFEATTSQKHAREIMGQNFFGVEEAILHFGVNPTKQQLSVLSEIPFSEATLEQCKKTHVLIAIFPLSILEIRGKVPSDQCLFYNQNWYNRESFARDRGKTKWQLIRKIPIDDSTSPKASVMVYAIIGHFLATNKRLFEEIYVRCSDVTSNGSQVFVGIDSNGLVGVRSVFGVSRNRVSLSALLLS